MKRFLFKDRDGQTPLPVELQSGLIPKNVQTMSELDEHEERNIVLGLSWLESQSVDGVDHLFWRKVHKKLFEEVWKWAGKVRTHELQNPEFLSLHKVESAFKQLEGDLAFWLEQKKLGPKEIVARFHERMLTIHPFPNGNGRFTRILTSYICHRQGLTEPTWGEALESDPKTRRRSYIAAVVAARKEGNYKALIEFLYS